MEIKKEYSVLFNAISDVIQQLEDVMNRSEKCLQVLKDAQKTAEEIYIDEDEGGN